jgi:hypothetical protein
VYSALILWLIDPKWEFWPPFLRKNPNVETGPRKQSKQCSVGLLQVYPVQKGLKKRESYKGSAVVYFFSWISFYVEISSFS